MAKIHILTGNGGNIYTAVVHSPTPAGNNSANVPWSDALKNSGMATTILPVGNGAGQNTQSEANQIAAGSVFETVVVYEDDPNRTNAERLADLDLRASQAVAENSADIQRKLKFFGLTRN